MKRDKLSLFVCTFALIAVSFAIFYRVYFLTPHQPFSSMAQIPAGYFIMGSDNTGNDLDGLEGTSQAKEFTENEKPKQEVFLDTFYIDMYEVTNQAYLVFTNETGLPTPDYWEAGRYKAGRERHPVLEVSWFDANSFCLWEGKRLPTEQEWEKAARGPEGNIYPWGNKFSISKGNFNKGDTVPVGSITTDKSYYGVFDLAGNLLEWTSSWYKAYKGSEVHFNEYGENFKVIRGATGISTGHYSLPGIFTRSSNRLFFPPIQSAGKIGFRCAKN